MSWCYFGPTYHGHPYLDGRGVFVGGHPLDTVAVATATPPAISSAPYLQQPPSKKKRNPR